MQILLGARETIIKVQSSSVKIEYIQDFIYKNFSEASLNKRVLYIPESGQNAHCRVFLLKWIYALYAKKREQNTHGLKEVLLNRYHKGIKIILSNDILYKIVWTKIDINSMKLVVEPGNPLIVKGLKEHFKNILDEREDGFYLHKLERKEKERVSHFIKVKNILNFKYENTYNKEHLKEFLQISNVNKELMLSPMQKAHAVLGTHPGDDVTTLKKRYKSLAKIYHPDKVSRSDCQEIAFYTQKFQNILEAYEILLQEVS